MANRDYKNVRRFIGGISKEVQTAMDDAEKKKDKKVVAIQTPDSIDLFGKVASQLETSFAVSEDTITATLPYVTGYTGFSSKTAEQSGHYLPITVSATGFGNDVVLTAQLIKSSGTKDPVTLDSDKTIVFLVKSNAEKVKLVATEGDLIVEKEYTLSLDLQPEQE